MTTNPTTLSPAAQAVLDAMHRSYDHEPTRRALAASVLRAAADQVVPKEPPLDMIWWGTCNDFKQQERQRNRCALLAIAAELDGTAQ